MGSTSAWRRDGDVDVEGRTDGRRASNSEVRTTLSLLLHSVLTFALSRSVVVRPTTCQ